MEKKNVLLIFPLEWHGKVAEHIERDSPNLYITENFEQALAMIRLGEVNRLCICLRVDNFSQGPCRKVSGQEASEKIKLNRCLHHFHKSGCINSSFQFFIYIC